jgi:hypothetical protein
VKSSEKAYAVLGPDVNAVECQRLKGLIETVSPLAELVPLPMFAEDFLDAFDRSVL